MEFHQEGWDGSAGSDKSGIGRPFRTRRPRADFEYGVYNEFPVTYTPIRSGIFKLYLNGPIYDPNQFVGHMEAFEAAGEDDEVHIYLTTPGGSMDATDTFLNAMHACKARVVIHASGGCHSCGSIILLHANEFTLSENFNALIHNGSTGAGGDLNKFKASAKHSAEYMERVMRRTYEGFLTPYELDAMIEGKDFWMDGAEWMRRHEVRMQHYRAKMQAAQQLGNVGEAEEEPQEAPPPRRRRRQD